MSGVRRRIAGAFASTSVGYALTVVIQFATVPIMLKAWGVPLYGEWLLLTTIPAYFAISDLGLGAALGNDMAISTARGDHAAAIAAFQSVGLTNFVLGFSTVVLVVLAAIATPSGILPHLSLIKSNELLVLIVLLMAQVWIQQQLGIMHAGLRCVGRYVLGNVISQIQRFAEFLALVAAVLGGGGPVAVASAVLGVRAIALLFTAMLLRKIAPWLKIGASQASFAIVRRLARPGLLFLILPIATALNLQTPLVIVGAVLGPEATVAFSTARTISRAIQQIPNVVTTSVWAEISHAFGTGNMVTLRRIFRFAVALSMWITALGSLLLAAAGPFLYGLWTHRMVALDSILLYLLLLVAVTNALWFSASVIFTATNRHAGLAIWYLITNGVTVLLCWILAETWGLRGVAIALVLGECVMAAYVLSKSVQLVGDKLGAFTLALLFPAEIIRDVRRGSWFER